MLKSILASLTGDSTDTAVLKTAEQLAVNFSAHVDCLHVSYDDPQTDTFAARQLSMTVDQIQALQKAILESDVRARSAFDAMCERKTLCVSDDPAMSDTPSCAYKQVKGVDIAKTIRSARLHDLTIIARTSGSLQSKADRAGEVMLSSGRPILVPSRRTGPTLGAHIVVAWKDCPEAARALAFASPLLAQAKAVTILAACEGEKRKVDAMVQEVADALKWCGMRAAAKVLDFSAKQVGETILDEAYRLDADLLVMGGYGHSRLRELVFGGTTREVLAHCEIPLFLSH